MASYSRSIAWLIVLCFSRSGYLTTTAKDALQESVYHFDKGRYDKAIEALRDISIRNDFDNSDDMKQAFKIRAIAYEQTGEITRAEETIRELFFLDPDYKFDPFDTPKSVVNLAHKEKEAIDKKNRRLLFIKTEAKNELEKKNQKPPLREIKFIEKKPHFVVTLFPMGLNHFFLDSPTKGGIYLGIQALALSTNIGAFWWKQGYLEKFGSSRLINPSMRGNFNTAQVIQYVALGSLLISYGISIIDALIKFNRTNTQKYDSSIITS